MVNMFALILEIATFIAGILWCLERFKFVLVRYNLIQQINQQCTNNNIMSSSHDVAMNINNNKTSWIKTYASIFPVLLLVFIVRSIIFEPFQIPSGSMMPTLLAGDFILVKKFAYGIKEPITQKTLIEIGHPKRGDVVVFKYPHDPSLDYIKRVVGLPGDCINYDPVNKRVTVQTDCANGGNCSTTLPITYSEFVPSDFVQIFNPSSKNEVSSSFLQVPPDKPVDDGIRLVQRKESLGGVMHNVLTIPRQQEKLSIYYQPSSPLMKWLVPQGEYFMMGDNRDNSADSRYWGFVPERNLVGKAAVIWMSFDKQEGQWPTSIRLSRIGSIN